MPTSHDHGQVSALVALISNAAKTVEILFAQSSKPNVPSLDDTEPHPFDESSGSMDLRLAIQTIEGACAQLVATVSRPSHTLFNKTGVIAEPACMDVVIKHNIAALLNELPEKGMHVAEIASRTGLNENKIERILRLLATKHIFREVTDGVFVNNRLSMALLRTPGVAEIVQYNTQQVTAAVPYLNEVLTDKEWGHSFAPNNTAFNKSTGYQRSLFEYLGGEDSEEGAKLGARFGVGMIGWGIVSESHAVVTEFPWKDLPQGTTVVDLGSGIGGQSIQLAKRYPSLRLFLQDLPDRMKEARETFWPKECPEAITEGRVHFETIDFFAQSPIPGADIYYIKNILHDWPNDLAVKILVNVRNAMAPHSRVLIHEHILQDITRVSDERYIFEKAPEPLLPNYGAGRLRPYNLDISMMLMTNSAEHRLQDYITFGNKANLKFVKLWDLGETSIVEFGLPESTVKR